MLCCVPIWRVHYSKPSPPMDLLLCKPLLHTPYGQLQSLTFVKGSLCGDPEAMRWGARCMFYNFPYFHVPTWEVALVTFQGAPSGAHMWDRRSLVSSHCV